MNVNDIAECDMNKWQTFLTVSINMFLYFLIILAQFCKIAAHYFKAPNNGINFIINSGEDGFLGLKSIKKYSSTECILIFLKMWLTKPRLYLAKIFKCFFLKQGLENRCFTNFYTAL